MSGHLDCPACEARQIISDRGAVTFVKTLFDCTGRDGCAHPLPRMTQFDNLSLDTAIRNPTIRTGGFVPDPVLNDAARAREERIAAAREAVMEAGRQYALAQDNACRSGQQADIHTAEVALEAHYIGLRALIAAEAEEKAP